MYASPVTVERFGDISDGHLATAFSCLLVNPEAVLFRL
jgi:two-component system cell cycle sensor histidine kinase/response regulator CckA